MHRQTSVRTILDSVSPDSHRLTTLELTFPRFILAEFNTHRMLSRNSASSRAIPTENLIERVEANPFVPIFNARVKGMGVGHKLPQEEQESARQAWLGARDAAVIAARTLIDVDKSRANRLLEPFIYQTAIVSATEWSNFLALRDHEDAQPEFRELARLVRQTLHDSAPEPVDYDQWHLPLIDEDDYQRAEELLRDNPQTDLTLDEVLRRVSVGRCARVSYLTHDGRRDLAADVELHDRLRDSGHMSPFEHVARPMSRQELRKPWSGNFYGWQQYRKDLAGEEDYTLILGGRY